MVQNDKYGFSADRPIRTKDEDMLNRAGFSTNLADAIMSWRGKDSLVTALRGDWGSGKSSIKNMALTYLKTLDKKPTIIEFSPWEWAAQDKINSAFFEEISKAIGKEDKGKNSKKTAALFKKYGVYLNTGGAILSLALPFIPIISVVLPYIKGIAEFFNIASSHLEEKAKGLEKSLSDIRDELRQDLEERESSILIVMDDLDRLTSRELKMIFQLIKANSEFPNVIFLLLFQRDIVEDKLIDGKQSGANYLEKIIQVPFDIPKIEISEIHNLLLSKLNEIISKNESAKKNFDPNYWGKIFHSGLNAYFDNLRDVYRYISTFSFHFSLLNVRSVFEVNPVDLIAIECIRLFEPEIYKEISNAKDLFTTYYRPHEDARMRDKKEKDKERINLIFDKASPDKREIIKQLTSALFPTIKGALDDISDGGSGRMRIYHSSNFDKYFQFSIPKREASQSDLYEMLSLTAKSDEFSSFILDLQNRGLVKNALSQFQRLTNDIPLENGETYIKGLLDVGDQLDNELPFMVFSSHNNAVALVYEFLKRIEDKTARGELLLKCFSQSDGISLVEHILGADENSREKPDPDTLLSDAEFSKLKNAFVQKLDYFSENTSDQLIKSTHLLSLLYRWKKWGDASKVSDWLQANTSDVDDCLNMLKKFMDYSSSQTISNYTATNHQNIKLETIENFMPIMPMISLLENVNAENLDEKEKEALLLFRKAVEDRNNAVLR